VTASDQRQPGPLRRLLRLIGDLLPTPPEDDARDRLLDGVENLPPDERAARVKVLYGRSRWGRGNG
jgi:hypothetical protein